MENENFNPVYIGDGVYMREGNYKGCIILYCDNGLEVYERIHLEPDMMERVIKHYRSITDGKV